MANTYSRFAYRRAGEADGFLCLSPARAFAETARHSREKHVAAGSGSLPLWGRVRVGANEWQMPREVGASRWPSPQPSPRGRGGNTSGALSSVQFQRGAAVNSSGSAVVLLICSIEKADETPDSCAVQISFL